MGGAITSRNSSRFHNRSGIETNLPLRADVAASLDETWREFKITNSPTLRNWLIIHYMNSHVRKVAQRLQSKLPPQIEVEDLVDEAYEALVDLINRFDLEKDVQFETFSNKRLNGAMRDYLRRIDPIPRLARTRSKQAQALIDDYTKHYGYPPNLSELRRLMRNHALSRFRKSIRREPTPQEHAMLMKHADSSFNRMRREGKAAITVSFNTESGAMTGEFGDDNGDAMANFQDHRKPCPLSKAERADLRKWITRGFARRDQLIIILYYYEQMTMKEIGSTLGCSESRVSQRLELILESLRSRLDRLGWQGEFYRK